MYTLKDYQEQMSTCKCELDTLKDIVDEFVERWQNIASLIDDTIDSLDDVPTED